MQNVCNECHGTGQVRYFKGESRFVLSHDECPACAGLGFIEVPDTDSSEGEAAAGGDRPQRVEKRKRRGDRSS
jgi:DnaJ-class molecular chaperone